MNPLRQGGELPSAEESHVHEMFDAMGCCRIEKRFALPPLCSMIGVIWKLDTEDALDIKVRILQSVSNRSEASPLTHTFPAFLKMASQSSKSPSMTDTFGIACRA